jgi:hypothetical protein
MVIGEIQAGNIQKEEINVVVEKMNECRKKLTPSDK